jgi:hypothetical protein
MLDDKLRVVACPRATFRACRRRFVDHHRLDPGTHVAPPQIQAEPARDGDEPWQNQSLRIESLEIDDGSHARVLSEVLSFDGSEPTPTETKDRPMNAEHSIFPRVLYLEWHGSPASEDRDDARD